MRYIMTFVWSVLLVSLLNYVVGAIANISFNPTAGVFVSLFFAALVILVGETIPEEPVSDN